MTTVNKTLKRLVTAIAATAALALIPLAALASPASASAGQDHLSGFLSKVIARVAKWGRAHSRRTARLYCLGIVGVLMSAAFVSISAPAWADVANTKHALPVQSKSVTGVSFLCGPTQTYDCTTGGYAGTEPWGYYTSYGSKDSAGRLHNCTSYAAFKAAAEGVKKPTWHDNANGWAVAAAKAGTPVDQTPAVGAVAQWNGGGYGHVAFVESVDGTGIVVSEDNYVDTTSKYYPGGYTAKVRINFSSNAMPDNFIHFEKVATGGTGGTGGGGGGSPKPKVDLVFAIDTTGSMGPYIASVKASATKIANDLFAKADARVALVDYKDLYASCPSDGYAARVDLPFSTSAVSFNSAVSTLGALGGCDAPESVYSGLMTAIRLPWRNGVTKAVLVMGDAPPHSPEPVTGYTSATVLAAAKAVDPASLYFININGGGSPYFEELAGGSAGISYTNTDPSTVTDQIEEALTAITASALTADPGGPYFGVAGEPVTFDASNSVAGASPIGTYEWDFDGDGNFDVTTTSPVTTHVYAQPYKGPVTLRVTTTGSTPQSVSATTTAEVGLRTKLQLLIPNGADAGVELHVAGTLATLEGKPLVDVPITFMVGSAECSATTNSAGRAGCQLKREGPAGEYVIIASTKTQYPYVPTFTMTTATLRQDR